MNTYTFHLRDGSIITLNSDATNPKDFFKEIITRGEEMDSDCSHADKEIVKVTAEYTFTDSQLFF